MKRRENVEDMQMFLLMESEDILFNMLCVQLHMMLQSPRAPQSALCVVHRPTICPPLPSLFSILSLLLPEQVTPAD